MGMFGQTKANGGKPAAALSSTLLARKGQAKPAMRPQGFGGFGSIPGAQDDLGWNDMGEPVEAPVPPVPPVLAQREVLHEVLLGEAAAPAPEPVEPAAVTPVAIRPVSLATAARIGRETVKKHDKRHPKAAFTLRLDADRHLRLRLASALSNASAQTLVTEALDRFLQSLPEVDDLVRQLPNRASR